LPLLYARKEVFDWIKQGKKTIDIRKGIPRRGEIVVFQSGPNILRYKIAKKESGYLEAILRLDNFKQVIPSALELGGAFDYFMGI
jgi:ASC-1-like (ASCH) protein